LDGVARQPYEGSAGVPVPEAAAVPRTEAASPEHLLGQLFEHAPVPTVMVDRDMRYIAMSRSWRRIFGIGDADVIGRSHYEVTPSIPEKWKQEHQACLAGAIVDKHRDRMIWIDGREIWIRRRLHPWRDPEGEIGGLIITNEIITDQIAASMELEHNQRFLEAVLANVDDAILAKDADGRLTLFNEAAKRWFGVDKGEFTVAKPGNRLNFYRPGDAEPLDREARPLARALRGEHVQGEELIFALAGKSSRQIVVTATPMHDRDGKSLGAVATARDVTSEREATAKWRKAEAWYRGIFDQSFQSCALLDPNGTVLELNASARQMTGNMAGSQVGRAMWDCVWWDTGADTRDRIRDAVEKAMLGEFVRSETEARIRGGRLAPIDFSLKPCFDEAGAVSFIIAEARDVTRQRAIQERYRSLYNHTPVMLHSIDRDGCLVHVSDYWLETLGYAREEVLGRPVTDFMTSDSARKATEEILPEFMRTGTCKDVEYRFLTKTGAVLEILLSATAERDGKGEILRFLAVLIDVTERREVEQKLIQAQKMESVGQLTGGLAHDFNNLLGVILGNLQLLRGSVRGEEKAERRLGAALGAVERAAELTRRLLAFARRQELETRTTDPNLLIEGVTDLLHQAVGETISLELHLAGDVPNIQVDRSQLESAILNLAVNARDAMPEGGRLTIETSRLRLQTGAGLSDGEITPGDYVVIAVTDTGAGIAPETLRHVFEPFFTTKDVGKGSGLGLSTVYGFVKQSGDHVRLYSEPGEGTTVRIYLPVREPGVLETAPVPADDTAELPRGSETILVVEDKPAMREIAVLLLSDLGYTVLDAANGAQSLEILGSTPRIDLLFTDIVMPGGMNGTALAKAARQVRPGLPVVFTTGYAEAAVLREGKVSRENNLVTKPYKHMELAQMVRSALDAAARHV
jgi:PAS domain S-box-containing protein